MFESKISHLYGKVCLLWCGQQWEFTPISYIKTTDEAELTAISKNLSCGERKTSGEVGKGVFSDPYFHQEQ